MCHRTHLGSLRGTVDCAAGAIRVGRGRPREALRHLARDLESHLDLCPDQPGEMLDNLVGNFPSITAKTRRIEAHGSMEALYSG
jgi:hypothetical protein